MREVDTMPIKKAKAKAKPAKKKTVKKQAVEVRTKPRKAPVEIVSNVKKTYVDGKSSHSVVLRDLNGKDLDSVQVPAYANYPDVVVKGKKIFKFWGTAGEVLLYQEATYCEIA